MLFCESFESFFLGRQKLLCFHSQGFCESYHLVVTNQADLHLDVIDDFPTRVSSRSLADSRQTLLRELLIQAQLSEAFAESSGGEVWRC